MTTAVAPHAAARRTGATIDLHMHSTASDGMLPPAAVVAAARAVGLVAIALTDHDTVDGIAEARRASEHDGIRVVAGIELSAEEEGAELHVLGLHLQDLGALSRELTGLREARVERARAMVERLRELGKTITFEAVLAHAAGGAVGRPHVARALIDAGHVSDHREAFDRLLGAGRPAYVPKAKLTAADAARMVHGAGGLAVWAHPGSCADEARARTYAGHGLDGLEVLHPSHSADEAKRIRELCDSIGLVPSGGSDWHATPGSTRSLGNQGVPAEWLDLHEAALRRRHANRSG